MKTKEEIFKLGTKANEIWNKQDYEQRVISGIGMLSAQIRELYKARSILKKGIRELDNRIETLARALEKDLK